jgi:hypothetical protein
MRFLRDNTEIIVLTSVVASLILGGTLLYLKSVADTPVDAYVVEKRSTTPPLAVVETPVLPEEVSGPPEVLIPAEGASSAIVSMDAASETARSRVEAPEVGTP